MELLMPRSAARLSVLMAVLVTLAACAVPQTPGSAVPAAAPVSPDQDFLNRAATGTATEVELGHLAQMQGVAPAIRSFGAQIAAEHGRANARLNALAQQLGMVANAARPDISML